jgi:hypothetical protein
VKENINERSSSKELLVEVSPTVCTAPLAHAQAHDTAEREENKKTEDGGKRHAWRPHFDHAQVLQLHTHILSIRANQHCVQKDIVSR